VVLDIMESNAPFFPIPMSTIHNIGFTVTIVLVGDCGVGKSDLLQKILNPKRLFKDEIGISSIGPTYALHKVKVQSPEENVQIECKTWDISGAVGSFEQVTVPLLR
jgi:septin family protein